MSAHLATLPAPLVDADDGRVPVTVWLEPGQAARLELLLAGYRDAGLPCDDNARADAIFALGLRVAEAALRDTLARTDTIQPEYPA